MRLYGRRADAEPRGNLPRRQRVAKHAQHLPLSGRQGLQRRSAYFGSAKIGRLSEFAERRTQNLSARPNLTARRCVDRLDNSLTFRSVADNAGRSTHNRLNLAVEGQIPMRHDDKVALGASGFLYIADMLAERHSVRVGGTYIEEAKTSLPGGERAGIAACVAGVEMVDLADG